MLATGETATYDALSTFEYLAMMETDPPLVDQPSPVANRMRRSRERRRRGEAIITLEVGPAMIAGLVALGWLPESNKVDKGAMLMP
jgi:hypothetical protein